MVVLKEPRCRCPVDQTRMTENSLPQSIDPADLPGRRSGVLCLACVAGVVRQGGGGKRDWVQASSADTLQVKSRWMPELNSHVGDQFSCRTLHDR